MIADDIKILVGKTINSIFISSDNNYILFKTNNGDFCFYAEGDCCSSSWIESIDDAENIIGEEILDIIEHDISMVETDEDECLDIMNYDLKSKKGICTIDFRNESNGHYGGNLELTYDTERDWKEVCHE